jgi:hypothetical protein
LLVNGATTAGLDFWRQVLAVLPNTEYQLSGWASSLYPGAEHSPGVVQMYINGTATGSAFEILDGAPNWQAFAFSFNSGPAANVTVSLRDLNLSLFPNDLAIDDLEINPVPEPSLAALICLGWGLQMIPRSRAKLNLFKS